MSALAKKLPDNPATLEDLLAIPEAERHHEVIDGELVERAPRPASTGARKATS